MPRPEILGFKDGYTGLIENNFIPVGEHFFDDLLYTGGTILGSIRQPFKNMADPAEDGVSKLDKMVENYRRLGLDCLVTLGGAGTHKTAAMLSAEGCNVIGLPKTIDNDIWGTEFTFGFDTAAEVAAKCVREMHATAYSHGRTILVEVMGNKTGWLSLYAAVAGGAHACILPEFPYDETALAEYIARRRENGARYDVIVVAEGRHDERGERLEAQGDAPAPQGARLFDGDCPHRPRHRKPHGGRSARAGHRLSAARGGAQRARQGAVYHDGRL